MKFLRVLSLWTPPAKKHHEAGPTLGPHQGTNFLLLSFSSFFPLFSSIFSLSLFFNLLLSFFGLVFLFLFSLSFFFLPLSYSLFLFLFIGHFIHLQKSPGSKVTCRRAAHLTSKLVADLLTLIPLIYSYSFPACQGLKLRNAVSQLLPCQN